MSFEIQKNELLILHFIHEIFTEEILSTVQHIVAVTTLCKLYDIPLCFSKQKIWYSISVFCEKSCSKIFQKFNTLAFIVQ